jgi:NADH-quinone oxidoreductase subunit N
MTAPDFIALLPHIIVGYGAVLLLVLGAYWRHRAGLSLLTLLILGAAFASLPLALPLAPRQITPLLRVDALSLFFTALFLFGGFVIAVFAGDYLENSSPGLERGYALLLFAVLGLLVLASSVHFVSFFLGVQALSVSLYGLIGFTLRRPASLEASLKYVILGGVALAFLLLGMALIYAEYGTMEFSALAAYCCAGGPASALARLGLGLILVAFGFKLALAPFHTWAPDVYQGAPAPVFALLIRFVSLFALRESATFFSLLAALSLATMFVGNLLALRQQNLKRMLACSSIAHMGYLLIPLLAGGTAGVASLSFYFVAYFLATLTAFGVISALAREDGELEHLEEYQGLGYRRPGLAAALALAMLSLTGIPLTVGFMAKLYLFAAAAQKGLWVLLVLGLLNSGVSAYYYLQVLVALYLRTPAPEAAWRSPRPATATVLAALSLALLVFGVYPGPLMNRAQRMAERWAGESHRLLGTQLAKK